MEIGPIFRALMNNKTRFWLITIEVALTLAIVANCVNMILDSRAKYLRETGMDEENLLVVTLRPFGSEFAQPDFVDTVREQDLLRLRSASGVRDATSIDQIPLSGGGSASSRLPAGSESAANSIAAPQFVVGDNALQTLGVELVAGRDFVADDFQGLVNNGDDNEPRNVILTQELADLLYPDGDAVGKQIASDQGVVVDTVVGIIRHMHCSWPLSRVAGQVMLRPGKPGSDRMMRYLVRASPGAITTLYSEVEDLLLAVNGERIVRVRTLGEYKANRYDDSLVMIKLLSGVVVLLILVTSLGIIGLTSFSVTERSRQIGTRRALGATKAAILRYFVVESWLINGIGLALGALLAVALNFALTSFVDAPRMSWVLLINGALLMWCIGVSAALSASLRAMGVPPEIATRTV